jgi:hypothetical protein
MACGWGDTAYGLGDKTLQVAAMRRLTAFDRGWLIGLFEGEGCIYFRGDRRRPHAVLQVSMTDEDVVRRLLTVTGRGHVSMRQPRDNKRKTVWTWTVSHATHAVELLRLMLPYLGARRAARAREALAIWKSQPPRRLWTHCRRGHALSGNNVRLVTDAHGRQHRCCRACTNIRARDYYRVEPETRRALDRARYAARVGRPVRSYRRPSREHLTV